MWITGFKLALPSWYIPYTVLQSVSFGLLGLVTLQLRSLQEVTTQPAESSQL